MIHFTIATQVAQVRMIFAMPGSILPDHPHLLAYVEWFNLCKTTPYAENGLYRVQHAYTAPGKRDAAVIRVDQIIRSCHLLPYYPRSENDKVWRSSSVLEKCEMFYINKYIDLHTFVSMS